MGRVPASLLLCVLLLVRQMQSVYSACATAEFNYFSVQPVRHGSSSSNSSSRGRLGCSSRPGAGAQQQQRQQEEARRAWVQYCVRALQPASSSALMDPARRQVLLREFDEVIAPQKAVLASKLTDAFRCYAPPTGLPTNPARLPGAVAGAPGAAAVTPGVAAAGGAVPRKRPASEGGGGSKRPRGPPESEYEGKVREMLKEVKASGGGRGERACRGERRAVAFP